MKFDSICNPEFYDYYLKKLFDHFNGSLVRSIEMLEADPTSENLIKSIEMRNTINSEEDEET